MNINRFFHCVESKNGSIDKGRTLDAIRERYGSVQAYCRHTGVNPRVFYRALHGDRGFRRTQSISKSVLRHLVNEGLLARKA